MARQAKSSSPLDAIAAAVSTGLIIGMVGSLIFFLIVAFYRGQYDTRLMYIFGLYTVATVLIARIAIDHGRAYANAFSLPLAVVSMLAMLRFVTFSGPLGPLSWIVNVALLAVAWYLADRITFDCTQVSERERSVQQGLLQSLGMLKLERVASPSQLPTAAPATAATNANRRVRKHNPGVWILYFALLAIPLFGLGQLAIPAADQRSRAFMFLIVYLACALSLLVLTALLGMQRYLRQRGVAMPVEMGTRWIGIGVGGVMLLLLLCLVLPLPGRSLGLIGLPSFIQSPEGLSVSRWGWGKAGPQSDAGESSESSPPASGSADNEKAAPAAKSNADPNPDPNAKSSAESNAKPNAESDNAAHKQSAEVESDGQRPSDGTQAQTQREQRRPSERQREQPQLEHEHEHEHEQQQQQQNVREQQQERQREAREPNESVSKPAPEPKKSSPPSWFDNLPNSVANLFKWLTLAVLAMIIIVYLVTHPGDIARLWRELQAWWGKLWGGRGQGSAQPTVETAEAEERSTRRPFASFANPFAGQLSRWSPADVVVHSFAALEAWAAERGRPRREQETTAEFARQVARGVPAVAAPAQQAAQMLDQLMFAGWQPQLSDVQPLADLWHALGR